MNKLDENKLDERGWKRLISAISNKEVVPMLLREE